MTSLQMQEELQIFKRVESRGESLTVELYPLARDLDHLENWMQFSSRRSVTLCPTLAYAGRRPLHWLMIGDRAGSARRVRFRNDGRLMVTGASASCGTTAPPIDVAGLMSDLVDAAGDFQEATSESNAEDSLLLPVVVPQDHFGARALLVPSIGARQWIERDVRWSGGLLVSSPVCSFVLPARRASRNVRRWAVRQSKAMFERFDSALRNRRPILIPVTSPAFQSCDYELDNRQLENSRGTGFVENSFRVETANANPVLQDSHSPSYEVASMSSTRHSSLRGKVAHSVKRQLDVSESTDLVRNESPLPPAIQIPSSPGEIRRVDSGAASERNSVEEPLTGGAMAPASHSGEPPTRRRRGKSPRAVTHARRTTHSKRIDEPQESPAARSNGYVDFINPPARDTTERMHRDKLFDAVGKIIAPEREKAKSPRRHSGSHHCFGFPAESLQRERKLIRAAKLSESVKSWFDIYSQSGNRPLYLWKWCVHGADLTTMTAVRPELRKHVCDTKVLSIMLCVLLDDVTDEQGNEDLLEVLMQIVERQTMPSMDGFSERDRRCAAVTLELSRTYEERVSQYPLCDVYRRLLHFDLMQYFNTMRYSCLLNENLHLLNVTEHELYLPHAMHMMSFSTLDLMCTPDFDVHELGRYREAIWHAQCMGRVGNLLSTWEREIGQTDFTSGVFARAVVQGDLRVDQLRPCEKSDIEAAIVDGGHEQHFLKTWYEHRECLRSKVAQIHSIDLQDFVERQERFFQMHLACRGDI